MDKDLWIIVLNSLSVPPVRHLFAGMHTVKQIEKGFVYLYGNDSGMTTIQINEKTKIGKTVLDMLKELARIENDNSIKFLDETELWK